MATDDKTKPKTAPQKATHTTVDTIQFTREDVERWELPPFQRPLRVNDKVAALAESIKVDGGVVPGVITIGILGGKTYKLDGQHRLHAFMASGCEMGYADVRKHYFECMADMGREFVEINSSLVRLRPDDILRGLEQSNPALVKIRKACPFIGYDMIRRSDKSPIVSMSAVLRCWFASEHDCPATSGGMSSASLAENITPENAEVLIGFMDVALKGFGRDPQYARLWGNLNLTMCMWIYRRTVIAQYSIKTPKLTAAQFTKCMMALSADPTYCDWLAQRRLSDRDRPTCYRRIKEIAVRRLHEELDRKVMFPQPEWAS